MSDSLGYFASSEPSTSSVIGPKPAYHHIDLKTLIEIGFYVERNVSGHRSFLR